MGTGDNLLRADNRDGHGAGNSDFSQLLKKHGKDPYDSLDYALFILPLAILGARIYFFAFPYDGYKQSWSDFSDSATEVWAYTAE